jgi:hypothetical protein
MASLQDILGDIPEVLITGLKKAFPLRIPEPTQTDRDIWIEVGRQKLISQLEQVHNLQKKSQVQNVLNRTTS